MYSHTTHLPMILQSFLTKKSNHGLGSPINVLNPRILVSVYQLLTKQKCFSLFPTIFFKAFILLWNYIINSFKIQIPQALLHAIDCLS